MEDTSVGLAQVSEDKQVCTQDRGHIVELINMSIQQLWDMAYKAGFEDGMTFISKD
jgi:hypothetical protein